MPVMQIMRFMQIMIHYTLSSKPRSSRSQEKEKIAVLIEVCLVACLQSHGPEGTLFRTNLKNLINEEINIYL